MPVTAAASGLSYIQATQATTDRPGWAEQAAISGGPGWAGSLTSPLRDLKHLRMPSGTVDSALKIGTPQRHYNF